MGSKSCLNDLKFQISILTNKKVLFLKKILSIPCTIDSSFFSPQIDIDILTFLIKGFAVFD